MKLTNSILFAAKNTILTIFYPILEVRTDEQFLTKI